MRSKASIRGHPLHPSLIPFPFAFLWGAFAFDASGRLLGRPAWWATGFYLAIAGVVTALAAAVRGSRRRRSGRRPCGSRRSPHVP